MPGPNCGLRALPSILLIAGAVAVVEILLGFVAGHFLIRARAEPDAFLAFRPWLIVAACLFSSGAGALVRAAAVALFIVLATTGEWLLLSLAGDPDPLVMARALVASLAMGAGSVAIFALFGRTLGRGWAGMAAAAAFALGLLALRPPLPAPVHAFEHFIRPPVASAAGARPRVALFTDLPLVWGEAGAAALLAGQGSPPAVMAVLKQAADLVPVDAIGEGGLDGFDVLVLAQPRVLLPAELVRIDDWVRQGHGVLVLADPALHWAGEIMGNVPRPPQRSLLGPLTRHWGLEIAPGRHGFEIVSGDRALFGAGRVIVRDPGVIVAADGTVGRECRISADGLLADCRLGRGRALVVADADWLADESWVGPGPMGADRAGRMGDNGQWLAGMVRALAGALPMISHGNDVRWMHAAPPPAALLLAVGLAIPGLAMLAGAGIALRLRKGVR